MKRFALIRWIAGPTAPTEKLPYREFVALMAFLISLVALSINTTMPGLSQIGGDLGVVDPNDNQLIVAMILLGMGLGPMVFGPLSDAIGRKPSIFIGLLVFVLGCLISAWAQTFSTMLIGRVLQGIGVSGPRIVSIAIVRDQYKGASMAQVMSFVMATFILVPAIAPTLGQLILLSGSWRAIFAVFILLAFGLAIWLARRQPETLRVEDRAPLSLANIGRGFVEVLSHPVALPCTLAIGAFSGAFFAYLNLAQQVFEIQYALGDLFPLVFAIGAAAIGGASIINGRIVMRFGMHLLGLRALIGITVVSAAFLPVVLATNGQPDLIWFMAYLIVILFGCGIVFGNLNAMAMEPLGHIAGIGQAVIGAVSTMIAVVISIGIGRFYDGGVMPVVLGFAVFSGLAAISIYFADRRPPESAN